MVITPENSERLFKAFATLLLTRSIAPAVRLVVECLLVNDPRVAFMRSGGGVALDEDVVDWLVKWVAEARRAVSLGHEIKAMIVEW
eukprot:CAMPEP_0117055664 /NCGR_PEP_ID=MMETSP0472-20121206/38604_1 /TAXON_ID=693140 ORGANISM="Tiarina fusus, Strain LIS" /NCGR_SAMPLE_ID=MMETSP0472 /ASSEMBLY_ACC=CAM_ASM_000603 /LENGTH=85 /DNA_ID=CAMNT_0004771779 /DNA_START=125 /DNA_END=379 /DNA_ORIENTATION=+